jgi:hypothetical protein
VFFGCLSSVGFLFLQAFYPFIFILLSLVFSTLLRALLLVPILYSSLSSSIYLNLLFPSFFLLLGLLFISYTLAFPFNAAW